MGRWKQTRRQKLSQINVGRSEKWEESKKYVFPFYLFIYFYLVVVEIELAD